MLCEDLLQSLLVNDDAEDVPALPARPAWCQSEWRKWPESFIFTFDVLIDNPES